MSETLNIQNLILHLSIMKIGTSEIIIRFSKKLRILFSWSHNNKLADLGHQNQSQLTRIKI